MSSDKSPDTEVQLERGDLGFRTQFLVSFTLASIGLVGLLMFIPFFFGSFGRDRDIAFIWLIVGIGALSLRPFVEKKLLDKVKQKMLTIDLFDHYICKNTKASKLVSETEKGEKVINRITVGGHGVEILFINFFQKHGIAIEKTDGKIVFITLPRYSIKPILAKFLEMDPDIEIH